MAFSLSATFGIDATGVRAELKQLRRELGDFVSTYANLGAGLAVGAFVALSKGAMDLAAHIKNTALSLGISSDAYQVLQFAAEKAGVAQDKFDQGLARLRSQVTDAAQGNVKAASSFKALGLSADELIRLPLEKQYEAIARGARNATDKNAAFNAVSEIFGARLGPQLMASLNELAVTGYPKAAKAAAAAGRIMSAETIVALERADEAISDFKRRAQIAVGNILVNFRTEEGLQLLLYQFLGVVGKFGAGIVDAVVEASGTVGATVWGAFGWAIEKFRNGLLTAVAFAAGQINRILPDKFQINVANIRALETAGATLAEHITVAIAKTSPSTFKKDVAAYWDKAIAEQQKIVAELNRVDFKKPAAALRQAGKDMQESLAGGAASVSRSAKDLKDAAVALDAAHKLERARGETARQGFDPLTPAEEKALAAFYKGEGPAPNITRNQGSSAYFNGSVTIRDLFGELIGQPRTVGDFQDVPDAVLEEIIRRNDAKIARLEAGKGRGETAGAEIAEGFYTRSLGQYFIGLDSEAARRVLAERNAYRGVDLPTALRSYQGDIPLNFDQIYQRSQLTLTEQQKQSGLLLDILTQQKTAAAAQAGLLGKVSATLLQPLATISLNPRG